MNTVTIGELRLSAENLLQKQHTTEHRQRNIGTPSPSAVE